MDHPFLVLALELVTLLGGLPSAHPYSVYWVSSPNLGGDTVTIAGAGFSAETTVRLCTDPECAREQRESTPPWSSGWEHSIKFLLPVAGIEPPLWAQLCEGPCSHTAPPAYTVGVNRPQVSWLAGVCHQRPPAHGHVSPMGASVVAGSVLRVFGRSLAWDFHGNQSICRSATARGAATGTVLSLDGRMITAHAATCYEASFSLQGISVGHYSSATLRTIWGQTTLSITVTAAETASASQRIVLDVDEDFASDVPAALRRAAELPPSAWKIVQLGPRSYALNQSVRIPNRTSLIGHGRGISTLAFSLGEDAVATANTDTSELIWDAAITSDGPVPPTQCTGATAVARTTRQSARRPRQVVSSPCAADWALSNFSLLVLTAPAQAPKAWGTDSFGTKAIHARGVGFSILGLEIELRQANNSNALFVEGEGFEIAYNTFTQRNLCFWGDQHHQGMHDDSTDFVDSEVIQMHACTDGWFHNNTINWLCGGYTLNCCSHMIVEDNHIKSTEAGIEPHGNSIWQGDWRNYPSNNYWTFSHNTQTRPPHNNPANWAYHESLTTDGAGGWGSGKVVSVDGTTVTIDVQLDATDRWGSASPVGATALIVAGPGFGQSRQVVASTWNASSNTTLIVASSGWDHYVVPTKSILAVVVSSEVRKPTKSTLGL